MKKINKTERELLEALRNYPVLVHKNFCLYHAGERGDDYFDIDKMACNTSMQKKLLTRFVEGIKSLENRGLKYNKIAFIAKEAGPIGLIILASSFSQRLNRDVIIIRPWQKIRFDHIRIKGCVHDQGEYALKPNDLVLLLDDVITTGDTQKRAIDAVEKFNAKVTGIVCAFVRQEEAVRKIKEEKGLEYIYSIWTHEQLATLGFIPSPPKNIFKAHLAYRLAYETFPKKEAAKVGKALDNEISKIVSGLLQERNIEVDSPIKEGLKNIYLNSMVTVLQHGRHK